MNSNQDRLPGGRFVYASNDYWVDTQQSEIELSDLAPEGPYDAAILLGLLPDAYTAIVRGQNGGPGIALVARKSGHGRRCHDRRVHPRRRRRWLTMWWCGRSVRR